MLSKYIARVGLKKHLFRWSVPPVRGVTYYFYNQKSCSYGTCLPAVIDVHSFVLENANRYDGDASFLAGPTERTLKLWDEVQVGAWQVSAPGSGGCSAALESQDLTLS